MRYSIAISILAALILALTPMDSFAQQGQGGARGDRGQQMDRDRSFDRDRMSDRDRSFDRDRARDHARAGDQTRQRDRDRLQDPSSMKDHEIYGSEFMNSEEREQYRHQLGQMTTGQSRMQFQAQHEQEMQKRALQQGMDLVPPNQGPVYGGEFMSVQERNQYREQLRLIDSDQQREQFQAQHRERINQRAQALGLSVEEAE